MDIFDVVILSIVEGITEFLPVSSTGHLVLVSHLLKIENSEFLKSFEIIIQLGAIFSVFLFIKEWHIFNFSSLKKIFAAFLPTAIVGVSFYSYVKTYLLGNSSVVVAALFLGGVIMIIVEVLLPKKEETDIEVGSLSYQRALGIGLFQSLAIIPGVSRAAATIIGGRIFGLSRKAALEFSFILAIPTMLAATGLDLSKNFFVFSPGELVLLVLGFALSFLVASLSIKFLLSFIQKHSFVSFGIYRIALAVIFWSALI